MGKGEGEGKGARGEEEGGGVTVTTVGGIVCATKLKTQPHLVKKYANRSRLSCSALGIMEITWR